MRRLSLGIACLLLTTQVNAAPYYMTFTSTADNSQFGAPYVDNVMAGDSVVVTVVVDNGGSSSLSQTWQASDVVSVTFNFGGGAHITTFDPNGTDGLDSTTGTFTTDASGALTAVPSSWTDQTNVNVVSTNSSQTPNAWFLNSMNDKYYTDAFNNAVGIPDDTENINPANWSLSSTPPAAVPGPSAPAIALMLAAAAWWGRRSRKG